MAFTQFVKRNWIHVIGSNEKIQMARIKYSKSGELTEIQAHLGCVGAALGSEQLRIGLHLNSNFNVAYALSDPWFVLDIGAEIENAPSGDFAAAVVFSFNNIPINKNQFYYLTMQASGYTRVGHTHYLYTFKDYIYHINPGGLTSGYGFNRPSKFSTIMNVTE